LKKQQGENQEMEEKEKKCAVFILLIELDFLYSCNEFRKQTISGDENDNH
jgi:hypothetical protein